MRLLLSFCLTLLFGLTLSFQGFAQDLEGQEHISNFDIRIEALTNGDLVVTETITIKDAADQKRRGIFRELYASYEFMGVKRDFDYDLISIKRNGKPENYNPRRSESAVLWRIGRSDVYLPNGTHEYEIKYRVPNQVRRHMDGKTALKDEVYWNATGTFWPYPIAKAQATLIFPKGAEIFEHQAYTGRRGTDGSNYAAQKQGNVVGFETTRVLRAGEGLTIAASIRPGVIDPMSAAQIAQLEWIRNGGKVILGGGGVLLFLYYLLMWNRVGRDPVKPPVFPRYAPPQGYSPAAAHHIHYKGFRKMDWLTALMMRLSLKDVLDIEAQKKKTIITSLPQNKAQAALTKDENEFMDIFFPEAQSVKITLNKKSDPDFYKRVTKFTRYISKNYGRDYHRANAGWGLLGMLLSLAVIGVFFALPVARSGPMTLALILGIAVMNIIFFVLLRAPTQKGTQIAAEIEGFKLYLETAEEKRINTANPLGDVPPLMTVELYERFLPYAVALGVEKPWTKQFETTLPKVAKEYQPRYAHGSLMDGKGGSPFKMSEALASAMTAGVAAAAPVSQSSSSGGFSSGSGGGGFSGGGGGGGGGGSW